MATVGADIGGFTSKVCVSWAGNDSVELHVNRVSNRETPTVVAFDKRIRIYGEEADLRSTSLYKSSICLLPYIAGISTVELQNYISSRKYLFSVAVDGENAEASFRVTFDDQPCSVRSTDAYAFFVNKLLETVRKQIGTTESGSNGDITLCLAVPIYITQARQYAIHKSLAGLGLGGIRMYKQTECLVRRWCDSHLPDVFDEFTAATSRQSMTVAFLDVGFCHCTFFVAEITTGETFEHRIIAEESNDTVGTYQMVEKLSDFICSKILESKGEHITVPSRQALYIYKACSKALKELSVVPDVKIDCERVLSDGDDFSTTVSRDQFDALCTPLKENLETMMDKHLACVEVGSLLAIEALGGGSRVPFVKGLANDIAATYGALQTVRMSMDSTSAIANGAVCLAKLNAPMLLDTDDSACQVSEAELLALQQREEHFSVIESEEFKKRSILNEIDQYIIKTKNDARGAFSQHLKLEQVETFLNELEEFALDAAHNKTVTSSQCESQLTECRNKVNEKSPDYTKALEDAEKARQAEIERSNIAQQTHSISEVNMDVTLPKATCIKRAAKNKEEGNALITGGNIEMAAQHYVKALQYCSKVTDATEEEREQLDSLKLASNLNLAMCYIKMDTEASYRKAVGCCTQALDISGSSTKALYRRAFAYDKLNQLDDALSDARMGVEKFPDNAELELLHECLEKKVKLQEQRLKKVYSRMF